MDPDRQRLDEIYRLERENNKMLHSMRRNARWGFLFRILLTLLALGVPIWLYFSYLAPVVEQLEVTISAITGRKVQMEDQFSGFAEMFQKFQEYFKSASSTQAR